MTTAYMRCIREAAEARRVEVRATGDRPSQRRSAAEPGSLAVARATLSGVEIRAKDDSASLTFTGYASVTEHEYQMYDWYGPYIETVAATAFDKTLAQDDLDVPLVLGHDSMRRIARTTNGTLDLRMDDEGLRTEASLDAADPDVAYIVPKLRSGLIDEMSFMFRITRGKWSPDFEEYRIEEVDIHRGDVSIVGYGANPATSGSLRSAPAVTTTATRVLLELARANDVRRARI